MVTRLQRHVGAQIEAAHGEDIAALFDIYVGRAHVYYNPKIRLERLIYRGIREAANAATSARAARARAARRRPARRACATARCTSTTTRSCVADTREIFGYEALARGTMRTLRSPEVMFDVAAEADLIWELSRLCRSARDRGDGDAPRAGRAAVPQRRPARLHRSGVQRAAKSTDPSRVVIEITERTAIKDYPKFRERLKAFRERGLSLRGGRRRQRLRGARLDREPRAGLHQARHLADQRIDTNFIKQNLVRDDGAVRRTTTARR